MKQLRGCQFYGIPIFYALIHFHFILFILGTAKYRTFSFPRFLKGSEVVLIYNISKYIKSGSKKPSIYAASGHYHTYSNPVCSMVSVPSNQVKSRVWGHCFFALGQKYINKYIRTYVHHANSLILSKIRCFSASLRRFLWQKFSVHEMFVCPIWDVIVFWSTLLSRRMDA